LDLQQWFQWSLWQPLAGGAYKWGESLLAPFAWAGLVILGCSIAYASVPHARGSLSLLAALNYSLTVFCGAPDSTIQFTSHLARACYTFETLMGVVLPALFIIGLARRTAAR
jgi:hypothetical protein